MPALHDALFIQHAQSWALLHAAAGVLLGSQDGSCPSCEALHDALPTQVLDSALLRPGRFDRRVTVERPDRLGREQVPPQTPCIPFRERTLEKP